MTNSKMVLMLLLLAVLAPPLLAFNTHPGQAHDWLATPSTEAARIERDEAGHRIRLTNGLIAREFTTSPAFATLGLENLSASSNILRGVKPEAMLVLDGRCFEIGGLKGQVDYGYLDPSWIPSLKANPAAFQLEAVSESVPTAPYEWKPTRSAPEKPWPPKGATLRADFIPPASVADPYKGLKASLFYEIYDGIPVMAKWLEVFNGSDQAIRIDSATCEILAVNEHEKDRLHVESNFAFNTMNTTHWGPDREYLTQVDYNRASPLLMSSCYPAGPGIKLMPGERFTSFRTLLLPQDSDDRERQGLAVRRMYRTLAPQSLENPILMHIRESSSEAIRLAVDQCAEVGFEMAIITFWSGLDVESEDLDYIGRLRADTDYAHSKGIELGGYTLMCASRDVGPDNNCISPKTGKPGSMFGQSACLASAWSDGYFKRVLNFFDATGMDVIETDGPYHGDVCAATNHAHHSGLADSQLRQWERCSGFYHECRRRGIYINTPDWYYLNGSNKSAMGYREDNFSLPRSQQIIHSRQNIFDATFLKTPSMGWMFVPLVEYHGGGAAATLEPLSEHLAEYEWHLAQCFGSGVQACYRGPRLFDTEAAKAVVKRWVDFYKAHRAILDSDIIHVSRADGRRLDCMLHVNSSLKEKGLAMLYNPMPQEFVGEITLPLYYTGISESASICAKEGEPERFQLDREYNVTVPVAIPANSVSWLVIEEGASRQYPEGK